VFGLCPTTTYRCPPTARAESREPSVVSRQRLATGNESLGLLLWVVGRGFGLRADALGASGKLLAPLVGINPVFSFSCPQSVHVCASREIEAGQQLLYQFCPLDRGQREGAFEYSLAVTGYMKPRLSA
jgi:hypothetical protein